MSENARFEAIIFTLSGVRFGFDSTQVVALRRYEHDEDVDLPKVHNLFGLSPLFSSPQNMGVVSLHQQLGGATFVTEQPDEIHVVTPAEIRPFPPLMRERAKNLGLWGVVPADPDPIYLVDFALIPAAQRCP